MKTLLTALVLLLAVSVSSAHLVIIKSNTRWGKEGAVLIHSTKSGINRLIEDFKRRVPGNKYLEIDCRGTTGWAAAWYTASGRTQDGTACGFKTKKGADRAAREYCQKGGLPGCGRVWLGCDDGTIVENNVWGNAQYLLKKSCSGVGSYSYKKSPKKTAPRKTVKKVAPKPKKSSPPAVTSRPTGKTEAQRKAEESACGDRAVRAHANCLASCPPMGYICTERCLSQANAAIDRC